MSRAALSVRPLASRSAKLRDEALTRDNGFCAICGADTALVQLMLDAALAESAGSLRKADKYRETLKAIGLKPGQPLLEVDHIVPISEGGRDELRNLRCLCTYGKRCHAKVTKELAARRARRPKAVRPAVRHEARGDLIYLLNEDGEVDALVCECFGGKERFVNARLIARALNAARKPGRAKP